MNNGNKYITDDFVITDGFIEKYRFVLKNPMNGSWKILLEEIPGALRIILADLNSDLHKQLFSVINASELSVKYQNISEVPTPEEVYPNEKLRKYYLNQSNVFLRVFLGELFDVESINEEIRNNKTAFLLETMPEHELVSWENVSNHSNPKKLIVDFNEILYCLPRNQDLMNKLDKGKENSYFKFLEDSINYLKTKAQFGESQIVKKQTTGGLTAFEIALRHWYLVEARVENYIIPAEVGRKYGHLKDKSNIEKSYSAIDEKRRVPVISNLESIKATLWEYPLICLAIDNDIANLG